MGNPVQEPVQHPPLMGFEEERYIPGHAMRGEEVTRWAAFYTCIANGKRVYVWAWNEQTTRDRACVMVSDYVTDPARNASVEEIQNMYADQHSRQKAAGVSRTHGVPSDPFVLQAFIHEVTRGGNHETV